MEPLRNQKPALQLLVELVLVATTTAGGLTPYHMLITSHSPLFNRASFHKLFLIDSSWPEENRENIFNTFKHSELRKRYRGQTCPHEDNKQHHVLGGVSLGGSVG